MGNSRILTALVVLGAIAPVTVSPPMPQSAAEQRAGLDALVAAYPQALAGHDGKSLRWKSGTATPVGTASRDVTGALNRPSLIDIFAWPYPFAAPGTLGGDPGRARPAALFARLYGDCRKGAVTPQLVTVQWVNGLTVQLTAAQGAARALTRVARDLEAAGLGNDPALWPISGTYNCRVIAGTDSLSMHAYGAAIDLSSRYGAYWRWGGRPDPSRTISPKIVTIFERHGFIWGGKWAHFDSFHFEYRPEFRALAAAR